MTCSLMWCVETLSPQEPYWPLSMGVRNSERQDGDHRRNPSFIYNYNILDAVKKQMTFLL